MSTMQITVGGMTCDGCERSIARALSRVDGVRDVTADHRTGAVSIEIDRTPAETELRDAIEDAGYVYVPPGTRTLPTA